MGARSEGSASRAGLCILGVLSVAGFLPVLASSSVSIGVQSSAGANTRAEVAAPEVQGMTYERLAAPPAIAVAEHNDVPAPPPPPPAPEPPAAPESVPEPAPAPEPAPGPEIPAPAAPTPEPLQAIVPPEPQASALTGAGSGLTSAAVPITGVLPLPLVDEVVTPLLGDLLRG